MRQEDSSGIQSGALVQSLAGRDQGACYVVLREVDEWRVLVVNGRNRSVDQPKVKNKRHLKLLSWAGTSLVLRLERGDRITDQDIEKALAAVSL